MQICGKHTVGVWFNFKLFQQFKIRYTLWFTDCFESLPCKGFPNFDFFHNSNPSFFLFSSKPYKDRPFPMQGKIYLLLWYTSSCESLGHAHFFHCLCVSYQALLSEENVKAAELRGNSFFSCCVSCRSLWWLWCLGWNTLWGFGLLAVAVATEDGRVDCGLPGSPSV